MLLWYLGVSPPIKQIAASRTSASSLIRAAGSGRLAGFLANRVAVDPLGPKRRAADLAGVIAQRRGRAFDRAGQLVWRQTGCVWFVKKRLTT